MKRTIRNLVQFILIVLLGNIFFFSCTKEKELNINGAHVLFKLDEPTPNAKMGDSIIYHLILYNRTKMDEGKMEQALNNTYEVGKQIHQKIIPPRFVGGFEEALPYLSKGDSIVIRVKGSVLYSNPKILWNHPMIEKNDLLEYYIKVVDIKEN